MFGPFVYKLIIKTKRKLSKSVKLSEPVEKYTEIFKFLLRNKDSVLYQCSGVPGKYIAYKDFLAVIDKQKLSIQSDTINIETELPGIVCTKLEDEFDKEMMRRIRHHIYNRRIQNQNVLIKNHSVVKEEFTKIMGVDTKI